MDKQTSRRKAAIRAARQLASQPAQPEHPLAQQDDDRAQPTGDPFADETTAEATLAAQEDRQARLDAFAGSLASKRLAAVNARRASGIEEIWREDEEHYEGVDAANRNESVTIKPRDPSGTSSGAVSDTTPVGGGSNIFLNITRSYVDFSCGRAADMLLPTDEQNWDLTSTPMPDVIAAFGDERPMTVPGTPFTTVAQAAKAMVQDTTAKVDKAKKRIEDWFVESQYSAEQRKVLLDAAKVGVGILKGPFPVKKVSRAVSKDPKTGQLSIQIQNKTAPVSKRISYWNFFPSDDCSDDIHKGSGTWERDRITARELRDLKGTNDTEGKPMYIESAIQSCLEEGPQRKFEGDTSYSAKDSEVFDVWYFHGIAGAEDLRAAGIESEKGDVVPVMVTMVNDRVIKAALSTLDSGEFPYDVMVWQPREGYWAGIGISRQVRAAQRMLNGGVRNLMDNAGIGGGPMFIFKEGELTPAEAGADYSLAPRKFWKLKKDSMIDDVRKAFAAVEIPMITDELMAIIQFAMKIAEDVTGMPMLMQGQQGRASETVGGMQMLTNNSNTPMRAIAKQYDDRITTPHLHRYYEWLLMYGPEEDEKGEFVIAARGSSALFERDAQNQAILQMAPIVENPAYNIDPEKWFVQFLQAQRLDPKRFQYTAEQRAQREEAMKNSPPPMDPRIEAARITAESAEKREQIKADVTKERINADTDRDTAFVQEQNERTRLEHELRSRELDQKERMLLLEYATQQKISLEQVKTDLARDAMKIAAQKELAMLTADGAGASRITSTPPTEPPGQAERGEAYQA